MLLFFIFFCAFTGNCQIMGSEPEEKLIALVEPCYTGLAYIDAVMKKGYSFVTIVSNESNPKTYGYDGKQKGVIVADIRDAQAMINAIEASPYKNQIIALIPGTDFVTHLTSLVAGHFGWIATPYHAALGARRKDIARDVYQRNGVPNARYFKVRTTEEAIEAAKMLGYPVIVKPTDCWSSQNVMQAKSEEELKAVMAIELQLNETFLGFKTTHEFLVEEYLVGPEFSVEIILYEGEKLFASVTEKLVSKPPFFVEMGHVVPTSICLDHREELIQAAYAAVKALGFTFGSCHVEIKLTERGPVIVETNGRPGGCHISTVLLVQAFGVNVFEAVVDCFLGEAPSIIRTKDFSAAIAFLAADRVGTIKKVNGISALAASEGVFKYSFKARRGMRVFPPERNDDRLGYVICVDKTPELAKKRALEAMQKVTLAINPDKTIVHGKFPYSNVNPK